MERNRVVFENEIPSAHRMKSFFVFSLWSWAKMYSVDNLNSLVGFFVLDGVQVRGSRSFFASFSCSL